MRSRPRILIVEDNADLRRLYAFGLTQRGFEVKLAANGAEALDRLESEKPDVLILDLFMPVMSGWEVLERLHAEPGRGPMPVVVLTGQIGRPDTFPHNAISAWLEKPVMIEELATTVRHAIGPEPPA